MDSEGLRFGLSMDALLKQPTFSYSLPTGANDLIVWPRPVTVGVYAGYNPSDCESLSQVWKFDTDTQRSREPRTRIGDRCRAEDAKRRQGNVGTQGRLRYTSLEYDVAEKTNRRYLVGLFRRIRLLL